MATDLGFADISQLTKAALQVTSLTPGSCNMCKKNGLPILPVRYAVVADTKMRSAAGVKTLSDNVCGLFGDGVVDIPLKKARYTLRALRYGYVYIYYPKTARWQSYAVTEQGNLYEFPVDQNIDRSFEKPFSCTQHGHAQLAQCITIDHAERAGTVYLAFSQERWTKKVRRMYETNFMGCRDKRMQAFDATAWYNGRIGQPHADVVGNVENYLTEYQAHHPESLVVGRFPYQDRTGQTKALKEAMDSVLPDKGLFFELWDPVGIATELNFEQRLAFGAALEPYQRGLWAKSAIDAMHKAVVASARKDVENGANMLESDAYEGLGASAIFDGGKLLEKQLKSIEEMKKAELVTAGPEAWKPYTNHYRQQAITDFDNQMTKGMQAAQQSTLIPLSQDHQAWLSSAALLNIFQFDFEQGSWQAGKDYMDTLTQCIEGSADRKEAIDVLVKWANGSVTDTRNPLLRGLVLNSPDLADMVKEAASYPYMELREVVAKFIEAYSKIAEAEKAKDPGIVMAVSKSLARLLHEVGGPLVEAISSGVDKGAAKVIYATLCMRTNTKVECKAVYGSASQWVNYVAQQMHEMMPGRQQLNVEDVNKQLKEKAAPAGGGKDLEIKAKQFVVTGSPAEDTAALASVNAKPGFEKLAVSTVTPDVVEKVYMPKFRLMAKGEPAYAGIGAIFCLVNLRLAWAELKKSNRFNGTENDVNLGVAFGGLATSVAQYGDATIKAFEKAEIKLSPGWVKWGPRLEIAGKYGGAVVGLVSAAIDIYHAWKDVQEGNITMLILHLASAGVSFAFVYAALFLSAAAAAVVALPLLLIAAAIGVLMNYFKGREVDEWLERCYFGLKTLEERFPSLNEEQKAFAAMLS